MSNDNEKNLLGCIACMLVFLLWPIFAAWRGYVLAIMWAWFCVPLGAPQIGVWHSIGICLLLAALLPSQPQPKKGPDANPLAEFGQTILFASLTPAITLLFGFFARKMMG